MKIHTLDLCLALPFIALFSVFTYFALSSPPIHAVSVGLDKSTVDLTATINHKYGKAESLLRVVGAIIYCPQSVSWVTIMSSSQRLVPRALISAMIFESHVEGTSGTPIIKREEATLSAIGQGVISSIVFGISTMLVTIAVAIWQDRRKKLRQLRKHRGVDVEARGASDPIPAIPLSSVFGMARQDGSSPAGLGVFPIAELPYSHVRTATLHGQRATPVQTLRTLDMNFTPPEDVGSYENLGNRLVSRPFNMNVNPSSKRLGTTSEPPHIPRISLGQREEHQFDEIHGTPGEPSFEQQAIAEKPPTMSTEALRINSGQGEGAASDKNPDDITMQSANPRTRAKSPPGQLTPLIQPLWDNECRHEPITV